MPASANGGLASDETAVLRSRAHTLNLPRTWLGRLGLKLLNALEVWIVRVSRLPDTPVYDPADFPWVEAVRAEWPAIRAELEAVLAERERLPSFQQILKEVGAINTDDRWKTFFLIGTGMDCTQNARRCPRTMAALAKIPGACTAFFSILAPGKHIPAHRGAYNGVLRFHLGLIVPQPRERCRIRVADQYRTWGEGEALIFDDSFNHEVWNDTEGWRAVLFVDFARPLKQPWDWLNRRLIRLAALAPSLREAGARQRQWQRRFYRSAQPERP
jgi:aspartyl/asparaginyl beta-hydroxylase (cupin superfamily)